MKQGWIILLLLMILFASNIYADLYSESVFSEAIQLYYEGKTDDSIRLLESLIDKGSEDQNIYYALIDSYQTKANSIAQSGQEMSQSLLENLLLQEKKYIQKGLAKYTNDLKIIKYYTEISRKLSDSAEFQNSLKRILTIDSRDVFANYFMGAFLFDNQDYNNSGKYF